MPDNKEGVRQRRKADDNGKAPAKAKKSAAEPTNKSAVVRPDQCMWQQSMTTLFNAFSSEEY